VSQLLLLGVSHQYLLGVSPSIMDAAQAHREALKVEDWCKKSGIQSTSDLAFYFVSFEGALNEAGRAVAKAWQVARQSFGLGLQVLVRQLFAAESAGQGAPLFLLPRVQLKPSKAKPTTFRPPVPGIGAGVSCSCTRSLL